MAIPASNHNNSRVNHALAVNERAPTDKADSSPAPTSVTPPYQRFLHPRRLLIILAAATFIGEALVMTLLPGLPPMPPVGINLLDAFLITMLLLPLLDRFLLRPMLAQLEELRIAEDALRSEVDERKLAEAELAHRNQELLSLSQIERNQRQLGEALIEATAVLNSSLNLDEVLDRILEQTQRVVPCSAIAILLVQGEWIEVPRYRAWGDAPYLQVDKFPLAMFPRLHGLLTSPRPYLIANTLLDPGWPAIPELEWVRSLVLVPLEEQGQTVGFLATLSDRSDHFVPEATSFLVTFAAYAAVALHHARLYDAELHARRMAEALSAASLALTQSLDLETVLKLLLDYLHWLLPYDHGIVALLENEAQLVIHTAAHNDATTSLPAVLDLAEHPQLQQWLHTQRGQFTGERAAIPGWAGHLVGDDAESWLGVPIAAGENVLGFCALYKRATNFFMPQHLAAAEALVGQAAMAVQNAWLFQQVQSGHERLQSLSRRLVEIQESERLYIARELHDEAGQALASLRLGLGQLEKNINEPQAFIATIQQLRQVANGVQENLHRLAMDLRPAALDYLGLVAALDALVDKLLVQYGLQVQFKTVDWADERLDAHVEIALYRIAQEALSNVVRHAQATHVDILLERNGKWIMLMVEDDGIGFEQDKAAPREQLGILGMRERCEMLGGMLTVESAPHVGTTVVAEVPRVNPNLALR
jgi:signal transduction histidine kinase